MKQKRRLDSYQILRGKLDRQGEKNDKHRCGENTIFLRQKQDGDQMGKPVASAKEWKWIVKRENSRSETEINEKKTLSI